MMMKHVSIVWNISSLGPIKEFDFCLMNYKYSMRSVLCVARWLAIETFLGNTTYQCKWCRITSIHNLMNCDILTYFRREIDLHAIHVNTPRCLCPYFWLNPMVVRRKAYILMFIVIVVCSMLHGSNIWIVKSYLSHPGREFFQLRLSRLIYARSARSDRPGIP